MTVTRLFQFSALSLGLTLWGCAPKDGDDGDDEGADDHADDHHTEESSGGETGGGSDTNASVTDDTGGGEGEGDTSTEGAMEGESTGGASTEGGTTGEGTEGGTTGEGTEGGTTGEGTEGGTTGEGTEGGSTEGGSEGETTGGDALTCENYCTVFLENCKGPNNPDYEDQRDCITQCEDQDWDEGVLGEPGNTLGCRIYHAGAAGDSGGGAASHCGHAQLDSTDFCT